MATSISASNCESFVDFALQEGVLRFGEFMTKSGRLSPYFFNAGLFNHGASVGRLGQFYAQALIDAGIDFDMLFGPAYKGIPLATTAAISLSSHPRLAGRSIPFAFNRKEAKAHGEGGTLVGAPLKGKVVIIDDVITAGTSVNESVDIIRSAGAEPVAVLIALDRMERAGNDHELSTNSAVQEVALRHGMPVIAIANLENILAVIRERAEFAQYEAAVLAYRQRYGI
ncbi:orotate phosphoribosyltransferase [Orrella daihaiensis]|uniref:Orotate phosphoribosyltransferase n=1 Tax=Orrella daihaiensis TaxID=2782176 RepID=A0ABY4AQ85_9BURK|nr:orotate phosphoribosyltransferase [Orrella daihaiensis]UOD50224.1 orotate phosphoribosyltransferase [Orrella daihaiensis]